MGYYDVLGSDDLDLLGDYDVLGDIDDILGASLLNKVKSVARGALMPHTLITDRLKPSRPAATKAAAVANALATRGALVQAKGPTQSRRLYMGVDSSSTIAAAATSNITVQSVEPYRPELFAVSPAIASSFILTDIKIGRKSQLVGTGSISCDTISALAPLSGVEFDTAQTSQPLVVSVQNISGAALRFMATLIGTAVE